MRKYWRHYCCLHFFFTKKQLRQIERKHRILILPALTEDVVEKIFLRHFKELGFDKLGREEDCFEKIWERIGEHVDFKGVDCIGWKGDQPYTIEFETWASFARFHDYMGYLDYIVMKVCVSFCFLTIFILFKVVHDFFSSSFTHPTFERVFTHVLLPPPRLYML